MYFEFAKVFNINENFNIQDVFARERNFKGLPPEWKVKYIANKEYIFAYTENNKLVNFFQGKLEDGKCISLSPDNSSSHSQLIISRHKDKISVFVISI